jgi:hypothetical protein
MSEAEWRRLRTVETAPPNVECRDVTPGFCQVFILRCEFGANLTRMPGHDLYADNYPHEAALADQPPSGTVYQPDGVRLGSLGVHEHWNNATDKKYSRNLDPKAKGIELVAITASGRLTASR